MDDRSLADLNMRVKKHNFVARTIAERKSMAKKERIFHETLRYEESPKHSAKKRGNIGRKPSNGQADLDRSVRLKRTSPRRIAVDSGTAEFVVFDKTMAGVYHGHVRSWTELTGNMKDVLMRKGLVTRRGKLSEKQNEV